MSNNDDWGLTLRSIVALSGEQSDQVLRAAKEVGVCNVDKFPVLTNSEVAAVFEKLGFTFAAPDRFGGPPTLYRTQGSACFYRLVYTTNFLSFADRPDVPQAAEVLDYLELLKDLIFKQFVAKGFMADSILRKRIVELAEASRHGNQTSLERLVTSTIEAVRLIAEVEKYQPKLFQEVLKVNSVWPVLDAKNGRLKVVPVARKFLGSETDLDLGFNMQLTNAIGRVALQLVTFLQAYRRLACNMKLTMKWAGKGLEPSHIEEIANLADFGPSTKTIWAKMAIKLLEASYPDTSLEPLLRQLAKPRKGYKHSSDAFSNVAKRIQQMGDD